jgi:hypothetical protein
MVTMDSCSQGAAGIACMLQRNKLKAQCELPVVTSGRHIHTGHAMDARPRR